jgi:tRNA threonylcarbamoyladenosine biosynthesis protein TsaE
MAPDLYLTTSSHEETRKLGHQIGEMVQEGTVLALFGDLGSGKTTFVQGLARGLGIPGSTYVTSPTYTLINEYEGRCRLFHMDLYRINDPSELPDLGFDDIMNSRGVVAIEWSERLPEQALSGALSIHFDILTRESRSVSFFAYGLACKDLIKDIKNLA